MRPLFLSLLLLTTPLYAQPDAAFWKHWGDGKAEISSYRLSTPRYGELRDGTATLVFVTEDLNKQKQVKSDTALSDKKKIPVMKLNYVKKFQTGIYDYAIMTSVFSPLVSWSLAGKSFPITTPVKVSMSLSEWCGNYYEQINATSAGYKKQVHSYFEAEADKESMVSVGAKVIFEDDLLIRVRELTQPFLPGKYSIVPSAHLERLSDGAGRPVPAIISKQLLESQKKNVYTVVLEKRIYRIYVENNRTRYISGWEVQHRGVEADLKETASRINTFRTAYWNKNHVADNELRTKLDGL